MKAFLLFILNFVVIFIVSSQTYNNKKSLPVTEKKVDLEIYENEKPFDTEEENKLINDYKQGKISPESAEFKKFRELGLLQYYEINIKDGKSELTRKIDFSKTKNIPQVPKLLNKTASPNPTYCEFPDVEGDRMWSLNQTIDAVQLIAIPFQFCFYGSYYSSVYVSVHGNIQFPYTNPATTASVTTGFNSMSFPTKPFRMIAPYWADVVANINNPANGIKYGKVLVKAYQNRMVISWDSCVHYVFSNLSWRFDMRNSFQCAITNGLDPILPPGKNVGFYYSQMDWACGTDSGCKNGFPNYTTTTPKTPGTVGCNLGDSINYFQLGRFLYDNFNYDGPYGNDDGVHWLTGKKVFMNICTLPGSNLDPISLEIGDCDTIKICGNDTAVIKNIFIGPEPFQITNVNVTTPPGLLGSLTYTTQYMAGATAVFIKVNANNASPGLHKITMTGTDNGIPSKTTIQEFYVLVDANAPTSSTNGTIQVTPNVGICPGMVATASLILPSMLGVSNIMWNNGIKGLTTSYTVQPYASPEIYVTFKSGGGYGCLKSIFNNLVLSPVPLIQFNGNTTYCDSEPFTTITATNIGSGNQGQTTFTWTPIFGTSSNTFNSTSNLTTGSYSILAQNSAGCYGFNYININSKEAPNITSLTNNSSFNKIIYCPNLDSARVNLKYGLTNTVQCGVALTPCQSSSTKTVGTGTLTVSDNFSNPFVCLVPTSRHQYLYRGSELLAAGVVAGKINSLSFMFANLGIILTYPNTVIKIKCTYKNSITEFDNNGFTTVFSGDANLTLPITTFLFIQPYLWDGLSNILVEVCHAKAFANNLANPKALLSTTSFTSAIGVTSNANACISNFIGALNNRRPMIIFGNCQAQQFASSFSLNLTPIIPTVPVIKASKDSIKIKLPIPSATPITYTLTVTNTITGCFTQRTIDIIVPSIQSSITVIPKTATLCEGIPLSIIASGVGQYVWYHNQTHNSNIVATTSVITVTPPPGINNYIVVGNTPCDGMVAVSDTKTVTVTIIQKAILDFKGVKEVTKCANMPVILSPTLTSLISNNDGKPYTFMWYEMPSFMPASGTNNTATYQFNKNNSTTMIVVATGSCAHLASHTIVVNILPNMLVAAITNSVSVCTNAKYEFNSLVQNGYKPFNYAWQDHNNNLISNSSAIKHTAPGAPGYYEVKLTVQDSCAYTFTTSAFVLTNLCSLDVPNVISPDGDGVNDTWVIKGIELRPNTSVVIHDKWGRLVFETTNYKNDWNGSNTSGVYYYMINSPGDKIYTGFITVFAKQ